MNDITFVRQEVETAQKDWRRVRDVMRGERAVKEGRTLYLPQPNPLDASETNAKRYDQYVDRAVFYNATARTVSGLIGIAFRRWPELSVPVGLEVIEDDTDGAGGGIYNQAHRALETVLATARAGLLTDFPTRNDATSKADADADNIHPIITLYAPETIINWRVNSRKRLTLVVLYEQIEEPDGYGVSYVEQWRELTLENGYYEQRIWRKGENSTPLMVEAHTPLDAAGMPWTEIPFSFIGAIDNDSEMDRPPLLDLANLNLAHYRASADYFESAYFCGQPTFAASGLTQTWIADVWKDGNFYVGCREVIPLPEGGAFSVVQALPNTLSADAMERLEKQMVALGARLLLQGEAVKTADQNRSETAAAHSVLSLSCDNVSAAYTEALRFAARFTGESEDDIEFAFHTDFTGLSADANLINALVAAWQAGIMPKGEVWSALRQIGVIDPEKTDDDLEEEIDAEGGGLALDPLTGAQPGQPSNEGQQDASGFGGFA